MKHDFICRFYIPIDWKYGYLIATCEKHKSTDNEITFEEAICIEIMLS
jgi:hypothetical protein